MKRHYDWKKIKISIKYVVIEVLVVEVDEVVFVLVLNWQKNFDLIWENKSINYEEVEVLVEVDEDDVDVEVLFKIWNYYIKERNQIKYVVCEVVLVLVVMDVLKIKVKLF